MRDATGEIIGLVDRIRAGERDGEVELVERFGRGLGLLLRRLVADPHRREDLLQETLRLLIEKVRGGEVREPHKLAGFAAAIARNLVRDQGRRYSRRKTDPAGDTLEPHPDPGLGPLGHLLRSERVGLVRDVLAGLPTARDRELLTRHYLTEDDKQHICDDLGLSAAHYDRVLYRARQRYKARFLANLDASGNAG